MNKHSHIDDELLIKHLLGEAGEDEQANISEWIAASDSNKAHYEQLRKVWDTGKIIASKSKVDENAAWQRFQQRVQQAQQPTKTIPLNAPRRMGWMQIAAGLILLLATGWGIYNFGGFGMTKVMADNGVLTETLPDGTVVTINKGSYIKYDSDFSGDTRDVILEGEAFFDITPDKSKPFIITANKVNVKVVGTSFNVKSDDEMTEVIVETGIVEVRKKADMVKLLPNEKAIVKKGSAPIKQSNNDDLYNYYRTKEFVCKDTPLWRLVDVLSEAYGANIVFGNDQLRDLRINTTFKNESLDNILDIISQTMNVRVEKTETRIIIK